MLDIIKDIIAHTHTLGLESAKIVGDDKETKIHSINESKTVVLIGQTKNVVDEFEGTFGLPNLARLDTLFKLPIYQEGAQITIQHESRDGVDIPTGLHFQSAANDFENHYRFTIAAIIEKKIRTLNFNEPTWEVSFTPRTEAIQRFSYQMTANPDYLAFDVRTEDDDLVFNFGDHSTYSGEFVFEAGVGKLSSTQSWNVSEFSKIMGLLGDKTVHIGKNAMQIEVDSGLAVYKYIMPNVTK